MTGKLKADDSGEYATPVADPRTNVGSGATVEDNRVAAAPVLADLAAQGFLAGSFLELRKTYGDKPSYANAIPILIRWLPKIGNVSVRESIIRSLSVPRARPAAAPALIAEFKALFEEAGWATAWAVGNGLAIVADDSVRDDIVALATNRRYERAREMVVLALGNMEREKVAPVLIDLLNDPVVDGFAVDALGKLKAFEARAAVERHLNHPKAWIRRKTKSTLSKMDKAKARAEAKARA